jgi:hypothetical protein
MTDLYDSTTKLRKTSNFNREEVTESRRSNESICNLNYVLGALLYCNNIFTTANSHTALRKLSHVLNGAS